MSRIEGFEEFNQFIHNYIESTTNDLKEAIKDTAYKIEASSKSRCPVDTGRLRSSIFTSINEGASNIEAEIGTPVEYARFVEFGTYKQSAQPFLIPSFDKNKSDLIKKIKDIYNRG